MATAECLYTQAQCSGPRVPTPLCKTVSLHMPALIYLGYCTFQDLVFWFLTAAIVDVMFECASHSSKWIPCQRIPRKVIWSWFADLADMECITFLGFREENQLSNANQIYFPAIFIQTSIHDSGMPHGPHRKFSGTQCRAPFFPTKKDGSVYRFTFIWVFHPFWYCFCHRTNAVSKPRPLKSLTKTACLHSSNQKKRLCTDGGKKPWG